MIDHKLIAEQIHAAYQLGVRHGSDGVTEPMPKAKPAEVAQQEPVAWAVWCDPLEPTLCVMEGDAKALAYDSNADMEPLYRRPMLTAAEREAIEMAISACKVEEDLNKACGGRQSFAGLWQDHGNALRSLLERMK